MVSIQIDRYWLSHSCALGEFNSKRYGGDVVFLVAGERAHVKGAKVVSLGNEISIVTNKRVTRHDFLACGLCNRRWAAFLDRHCGFVVRLLHLRDGKMGLQLH